MHAGYPDLPIDELRRGCDSAYDGNLSDMGLNLDPFKLRTRLSDMDGAYRMPVVHAAAYDAGMMSTIPEGMREDMCMLLMDYFNTQALHNTSRESVMAHLCTWRLSNHVDPEFR